MIRFKRKIHLRENTMHKIIPFKRYYTWAISLNLRLGWGALNIAPLILKMSLSIIWKIMWDKCTTKIPPLKIVLWKKFLLKILSHTFSWPVLSTTILFWLSTVISWANCSFIMATRTVAWVKRGDAPRHLKWREEFETVSFLRYSSTLLFAAIHSESNTHISMILNLTLLLVNKNRRN